jgi:serine/threonine protein phosphatase 1
MRGISFHIGRQGGIVDAMKLRLFGRTVEPTPKFEAPPDTRIYAIGDIHGRVDLLSRLHDAIATDAVGAGVGRKVVVYLGDYVDRGPSSREVLDTLLSEPLAQFESVFLRGNHEETLLRFLDDASLGTNWFLNGGDTTVFSYGVERRFSGPPEERWRHIQDTLRNNIPSGHASFLESLKLFHVEGDYYFAHAGIQPSRALDCQEARDLLWIRNEFLESKTDYGKCIVHGHTISSTVETKPNRIGIDTGAYFSGTLSCLVLQGTERRVIQT